MWKYEEILVGTEITIVTAPKSDKNQSEIPGKNSLRSILKSMNTEQCVDNALLCDKEVKFNYEKLRGALECLSYL
ncbi:hypothetical protein ACS0TY_007548 [Phlomoides rotata]